MAGEMGRDGYIPVTLGTTQCWGYSVGDPPDFNPKNQVGIIAAIEEKFEREYIYIFNWCF